VRRGTCAQKRGEEMRERATIVRWRRQEQRAPPVGEKKRNEGDVEREGKRKY
jgi:hypothetical protein